MALTRRLHLKRYNQIINVLIRNGFGLLLEQLGIFGYLRFKRKEREPSGRQASESARKSIGERLRCTCEALGPTFVKIGQILSTRPDILSPEITNELEKLQDSVNPFPFAEARQVIEEEFGSPLESVFSWIDETPLAAASLSQVHRARLPTGLDVVVKVQRPGIQNKIQVDLEILQDLITFISNHTRYGKLYDFQGMMAELTRTLNNELDFRKEGENADRFRVNFAQADLARKNTAERRRVAVPEIRWIYTTGRILTMQPITGIRINQIDQLDAAGIDRTELGTRLAREMMRQILEDGFFHVDPHPGNLWIQNDGTIVFLDLGMVGHLSEIRKKALSGLFIGIATNNSHAVVEALADLDTMQQRGSMRGFEHEVDRLLDQYMSLPIGEIKLGELIADIFQLAFTYHICIPGEMTLIAKVLITLQGVLERLDENLNLIVIMEPMASQLVRRSFSAREISRDLQRNLTDYRALLKQAPTFMVEMMHKLQDEDYNFQIDLKNIDKIQRHLDLMANRLSISVILLAVSIIIAGIVIGASVTVGSSPEMSRLSMTILRIVLVVAAVILAGLIFSMFRAKKF